MIRLLSFNIEIQKQVIKFDKGILSDTSFLTKHYMILDQVNFTQNVV